MGFFSSIAGAISTVFGGVAAVIGPILSAGQAINYLFGGRKKKGGVPVPRTVERLKTGVQPRSVIETESAERRRQSVFRRVERLRRLTLKSKRGEPEPNILSKQLGRPGGMV